MYDALIEQGVEIIDERKACTHQDMLSMTSY